MSRGSLGARQALRNQVIIVALEHRWALLSASALIVVYVALAARAPHAFDRPTSTFAANDLYMLLIVLASILPISVWNRHPGRGRDYLWSLPVDQARHERLRVLAGGLGLLVCIAVAILASQVEQRVVNDTLPPWAWQTWLAFVVVPLVVYLFGSLVVMRAPRPDVGWALGSMVVLVLFPLGTYADPDGSRGSRLVSGVIHSAQTGVFFEGPSLAPEMAAAWARIALGWVVVAVAGLYVVSSTRREERPLSVRRQPGGAA